MKQLLLIVLAAAVLIVGSLSVVGAQEDSQAELTRLCAAFMERWEAAGGEASGLTIPDWCNTDAQASLPTTDSDNACEGGLLDGKCSSDWEWICGYYLQQWVNAGGWSGSYKFPDWCDPASLLPPKPEVNPTSVCYFSASDDYSFYYSGINQTLVTWYDEGVLDCSGAPHDYGPYYAIEASDEVTAQAICDTLLSSGYVWNPNQESGYNSPANLWLCYDSFA